MVNNQDPNLDFVLYALSDATRRAMLAQMVQGECSVSELAVPHNMSFAAVSKHLKVLSMAKFVQKTKKGRNYICRADLKPLDPVYVLLEELGQFWRGQLDALDQFLQADDLKNKKEKTNGNSRKK